MFCSNCGHKLCNVNAAFRPSRAAIEVAESIMGRNQSIDTAHGAKTLEGLADMIDSVGSEYRKFLKKIGEKLNIVIDDIKRRGSSAPGRTSSIRELRKIVDSIEDHATRRGGLDD